MASSESGNNIRIDKLNGTNYRNWKFNVRCLLMERGLWGYVNGSIVKPEVKVENVAQNISKDQTATSK